MDKRLQKLILDYQGCVLFAVKTMQRSGIPLPLTCHDWASADIPMRGELKGNIGYLKHGYGCRVKLPTGTVDFDFGGIGEIDGFDWWRLVDFAGQNLKDYGFENSDAVVEAYNSAIKLGALVASDTLLYYMADETRVLVSDICKDFPNDSLPHSEQDKVQILNAHSFLAADLMRENYLKLSAKLDKNKRLSQNDEVDFRIYFSCWLGYLRTTCEGFQKLNMRILLVKNRPTSFLELVSKCDEIGRQIKRHEDSLRNCRNNVFHFRENIEAILRFAADDAGRLTWACELHVAMDDFFFRYTTLCELHYLTNGREKESQMRRPHVKRRNTKNLPP